MVIYPSAAEEEADDDVDDVGRAVAGDDCKAVRHAEESIEQPKQEKS
jgi:hypothetical protein